MRQLTIESQLFVATNAILDNGSLEAGMAMVLNGSPIQLHIKLASDEPDGWQGSIRTIYEGLESNSSIAYLLCRQFLDVLALWNVCAFEVFPSASHAPRPLSKRPRDARPVISLDTFKEAFSASCVVSTFDEELAKSLGWFRRGLSSTDESLSFLALWNSLEIAANHFHTPTERTSSGIKNQIYQSFLDVWRGNRNYAFPDGQAGYDEWIDDNYKKRQDIAHGLIPLEPQYLKVLLDARASIIRVVAFYLQALLAESLAKRPDIHKATT